MKVPVIALLAVLTLSGCAQQMAHMKSDVQLDQYDIAMVPADIEVHELGVVSSEPVPEWTEKAKGLADSYLNGMADNDSNISVITFDSLSESEQKILDQHIALYDAVAASYLMSHRDRVWTKRSLKSDWTVGNGLSFLKEKTDANTVLVVMGEDYKSSGGRAATMFFAAIAGVAIPGGHSVIHAGLIDVESGEVLWTNTAFSTVHSLDNERGSREMLDTAFSNFPAKK